MNDRQVEINELNVSTSGLPGEENVAALRKIGWVFLITLFIIFIKVKV